MTTLKMIAYPFGLAIAGMLVVDLVGIALFGANSSEWLEWQNQIVSTFGTVAGLAGAVAGLYLAVRSQTRTAH